MAANDSIRNLIDGIVACDEQPSEEQMTELRKTLAGKVATMKHRVRHSRNLCVAGIVLFVIGYVLILSMLGHHNQPGNPGPPFFVGNWYRPRGRGGNPGHLRGCGPLPVPRRRLRLGQERLARRGHHGAVSSGRAACATDRRAA